MTVIHFPRRIGKPPALDTLSFVVPHADGGFDYWNVNPSGSYVKDCETGKAMAREFLDFIADHPTVGNGTLLACIVQDMIGNGAAGKGVRIGFLNGVNIAAMAGAAMLGSHAD